MTSFVLILLTAFSIPKVLSQSVTEYPVNVRTGKLNQFVGFATPRPLPPSTGPFVYGSVWASWSAWSFCMNNVRVRVRACNTVRGFSCLGTNQEFMECQSNHLQHVVHESDYEAVDPWEDDRREAMRQLYSHNYPPNDPRARIPAETNLDHALNPRRRQPRPFLPTAFQNAFQPRPGGLPDQPQIGQQPRNAIFGARPHQLQQGQQPVPVHYDPEVQREMEEIDEALRSFSPLPTIVKNSGTPSPASLSSLPAAGTTTHSVPIATNSQPQSQGAQFLPSANQVAEMPVIQSPLPPPQPPPSSPLLPQVPNQTAQRQPAQMLQMPQVPQMSSLSAPQVQQAQTEAQAAPVQVERVELQAHLVQGESSMPAVAQKVKENPVQTQVAPARAEVLNTRPQVMVQMPLGSTQVSQQTAKGNPLLTTETVTLSSPISLATHPIIAMVNSIPAGSLVSELPSLPPLSSSQTSWPSLSMVSSSLATLPQITSLLTTEPSSAVATTPTTTTVSEFTLSSVPSAQQQRQSVPAAKTLNSDDLFGTTPRNNAIFREHPQLELPPSNIALKKLQSIKTGRDSEGAVPDKHDRGISRKKPVQFLGEVQGGPLETLSKQITEHLPEIKSTVNTDVPAPEQSVSLLHASKTDSRRTLHSGEAEFVEDKNEDTDTDKALDVLLKKISNGTISARSLLSSQEISSNSDAILDQSELQSSELLQDEDNVNSLEQLSKQEGHTNIAVEAHAQKTAFVEPKINMESLKSLKRTTTRPLTKFELERLSLDGPTTDVKEVNEMKKEIEKLKETMKAMKDIIGENNKEKAYQKAINLNLVPRGPSTQAYPTTTPTVIDQSRLILLSVNEKTPADWTLWTEWQRCFCGKQVRTRVCHYEDPYLTKGCTGKSYESRPCDGLDNCPATTVPSLITTAPLPTTTEPRHGKPLYKPLSVAVRKPDDVEIIYATGDRDGDDISYLDSSDNDSELLQQSSSKGL